MDRLAEAFIIRKDEIQPILPVLTKIKDETLLIFPWDPEYPIFKKGEMPAPLEHGRLSGPGDNTTRVVLREGRWYPYCRT